MKNLNLTQNLHTEYPNYFLILLQKFIESLMAFTQQVEFCLIMKVQEEAKLCYKKNYNVFSKIYSYWKRHFKFRKHIRQERLGHAKDYVEMQWRILQQKKPDDYVISTDNAYSVKDFII